MRKFKKKKIKNSRKKYILHITTITYAECIYNLQNLINFIQIISNEK
jgi:hypothetical protein